MARAMSDNDRDDRRLTGERPGMNDNLVGPSFRDGPDRTPRSAKVLLFEVAPFLVLAGVVIFFATR
jgi:hypothetical protein